MKTLSRVLFMGCQHFPVQDGPLIEKTNKMIEKEGFERIQLMGDLLDLDIFSRFENDPRLMTTFEETHESALSYLRSLRKAAGKEAFIDWKEGNHDIRITNYAIGKAPNLVKHGLVRTLSEIFELDSLDINITPYNKKLFLPGNLKVTHGTRTSQSGAGYAVTAELKALPGYSVIQAHTHMQAVVNLHNRVGVECGWLGREDKAIYLGDKDVNWQQGFVIGTYLTGKGYEMWQFEPIRVQKGCFVYNGVSY